MFDPVHRISASSTKSMSALDRTSRGRTPSDARRRGAGGWSSTVGAADMDPQRTGVRRTVDAGSRRPVVPAGTRPQDTVPVTQDSDPTARRLELRPALAGFWLWDLLMALSALLTCVFIALEDRPVADRVGSAAVVVAVALAWP